LGCSIQILISCSPGCLVFPLPMDKKTKCVLAFVCCFLLSPKSSFFFGGTVFVLGVMGGWIGLFFFCWAQTKSGGVGVLRGFGIFLLGGGFGGGCRMVSSLDFKVVFSVVDFPPRPKTNVHFGDFFLENPRGPLFIFSFDALVGMPLGGPKGSLFFHSGPNVRGDFGPPKVKGLHFFFAGGVCKVASSLLTGSIFVFSEGNTPKIF